MFTHSEPPIPPSLKFTTVQDIKDGIDDFMTLDTEAQRIALGELLYPKILKLAGPTHTPRITGMLVDFEVLTLEEILEFFEDQRVLEERIEEAQGLILEAISMGLI